MKQCLALWWKPLLTMVGVPMVAVPLRWRLLCGWSPYVVEPYVVEPYVVGTPVQWYMMTLPISGLVLWVGACCPLTR